MEESVGTDEQQSRALASTRTVEAVVAALLFAFGAIFAVSSYRIGFRWAVEGPQSGFFPFYVSLIVCAASAVVLFNALRGRDRKAGEPFVERGQFRQVLKMLVPAAAYVLGIQLIGFYVSSAIYIVIFMRWLGKYSWVRSILLGVGIIVVFFFMFEIWFQVPLYKGHWDLTSWSGY